jgi:hypothetical protein
MHKITEHQMWILCNIVNKKQAKRGSVKDVTFLAQIGAIKVIDDKVTITRNGMKRLVRYAKKQGWRE